MQDAVGLLGQDNFDRLAARDQDAPVAMLNMLRYREHALYGDSVDTTVSGAQAYVRYGAGIMPIIERIGAQVLLTGQMSLLGPTDEWDSVFVVRYPSLRVFVAMIADPDYQAHVHHRQAALADSRLFVMDFQAGVATLP